MIAGQRGALDKLADRMEHIEQHLGMNCGVQV